MRAEVVLSENAWLLLIAVAPTLLLGFGWLIRKGMSYKDEQVQTAVAELEAANAENRELTAELKQKDGKLTEAQLRHMLLEERNRNLEAELQRLRSG